MVARVLTVAFQGTEVLPINVQVQVAPGIPAFNIVGLPDKAVAESRERIRASFQALGFAIPPKRITVNLAPADVQKEGSHYDLPIALGLLIELGIISLDDVASYLILGELGLDGSIATVTGILPAAMDAVSRDLGFICPKACGGEAALAGDLEILAPDNLIALMNHFKGHQVLQAPEPVIVDQFLSQTKLNFSDIKGQEQAKRAFEVAAAGGHHLLMVGPPGAGKSMLAQRLSTILPPLDPQEALEATVIHSLAGLLPEGGLVHQRPFRDPHHSASLPALVGGGIRSRPGEISLAHNGILFLDELAEFARASLESLRQPLETGRITVARAHASVTYPARVQLIAAMNPCRCGHLGDNKRECGRTPRCGQEYQARISGPLIDRFDIRIDVLEVSAQDLTSSSVRESSEQIRERVVKARIIQGERNGLYEGRMLLNAMIEGEALEKIVNLDDKGQALLANAVDHYHLSGRGYHRVLRLARTLADLESKALVTKEHVAEALYYRRPSLLLSAF